MKRGEGDSGCSCQRCVAVSGERATTRTWSELELAPSVKKNQKRHTFKFPASLLKCPVREFLICTFGDFECGFGLSFSLLSSSFSPLPGSPSQHTMRKEPLLFQPNGMKFVPQLYLTDRPGKQHLLAAFESETRLILGLRKSITINKRKNVLNA